MRCHKDYNAQQYNFCENFRSSGNEIIDNWFADLNETNHFIEFIPYEKFSNITYLAEGGFSKVYKATCANGIINDLNCCERQIFSVFGNKTVVLKSLKHSESISHDFLNELKNYLRCSERWDSNYIHKYYGITRHPETKNYMIVMDFAQNGDLHNYISKYTHTLCWDKKLYILKDIVFGLSEIHSKQIIHRDLHTGNILVNFNYSDPF
ncbi:9792_t:CDS:2 [Gigaspora margarita]|uniref:9792_t:CDS:1 n=1 Tax=Gigaspora margarita TaxID=4874 RepID=A0ABN7VGI6_GIGMA|nr:9792_t:CDS:2 [Gigaspora margarita]